MPLGVTVLLVPYPQAYTSDIDVMHYSEVSLDKKNMKHSSLHPDDLNYMSVNFH